MPEILTKYPEIVALISIVAAVVGFLLAIFFLRYLRMLVKIIRRGLCEFYNIEMEDGLLIAKVTILLYF